jgi:pimeloyl-ACP methyl ester carboxylesterase
VHATADTRVPITHAEHAHTAIPGSQLRRIDGGRHTTFLFHPDLQHAVVTWLHDHRNR